MADPATPQSIASTPQSGYIVLPDGRVVPSLDTWFDKQANNPQGLQVEQQRTALSEGYRKNVAEPVTDILGNFLSHPMIAAEKLGLVTPEQSAPARQAGRMAGQAVMPQDLTQAGIVAGTLATGGAAQMANLPRGLAAASRVFGGTAGGMAGGLAETGTSQGAASGAGRGLAQSGAAETAGALWDYSRTMGVARTRQKIQDLDARSTGEAMERIPALKGVFPGVRDARGLEDLVKGTVEETLADGSTRSWAKGAKLLSDYVEGRSQVVQQVLDQNKQQMGRSYFFPDAMVPGKFTDWDTARKNLSELGRKAFGGIKGQALEPTIAGVDSKQLYAETTRLLQQQLTLADPSGKALRAFLDGQEAYAAGRSLLKTLRPAFGAKEATRVAYNSDVTQRALSDKRADLMKKLGPEGYWELAKANRITPETLGMADVYQPGGAAATLAGVIPGMSGARPFVGKPSLTSNPLELGQAARTGVTVAGSQLSAPIAQYLIEQMRSQGQGTPQP